MMVISSMILSMFNSFAALQFLIWLGFCAGFLEDGYFYKYNYYGDLKLKEYGDETSGNLLQIKTACQVHIESVGIHEFEMKLMNFVVENQFADVYENVESHYIPSLRKSVVFQLHSGKLGKILISKDDTPFSVNIKKSIISHFLMGKNDINIKDSTKKRHRNVFGDCLQTVHPCSNASVHVSYNLTSCQLPSTKRKMLALLPDRPDNSQQECTFFHDSNMAKLSSVSCSGHLKFINTILGFSPNIFTMSRVILVSTGRISDSRSAGKMFQDALETDVIYRRVYKGSLFLLHDVDIIEILSQLVVSTFKGSMLQTTKIFRELVNSLRDYPIELRSHLDLHLVSLENDVKDVTKAKEMTVNYLLDALQLCNTESCTELLQHFPVDSKHLRKDYVTRASHYSKCNQARYDSFPQQENFEYDPTSCMQSPIFTLVQNILSMVKKDHLRYLEFQHIYDTVVALISHFWKPHDSHPDDIPESNQCYSLNKTMIYEWIKENWIIIEQLGGMFSSEGALPPKEMLLKHWRTISEQIQQFFNFIPISDTRSFVFVPLLFESTDVPTMAGFALRLDKSYTFQTDLAYKIATVGSKQTFLLHPNLFLAISSGMTVVGPTSILNATSNHWKHITFDLPLDLEVKHVDITDQGMSISIRCPGDADVLPFRREIQGSFATSFHQFYLFDLNATHKNEKELSTTNLRATLREVETSEMIALYQLRLLKRNRCPTYDLSHNLTSAAVKFSSNVSEECRPHNTSIMYINVTSSSSRCEALNLDVRQIFWFDNPGGESVNISSRFVTINVTASWDTQEHIVHNKTAVFHSHNHLVPNAKLHFWKDSLENSLLVVDSSQARVTMRRWRGGKSLKCVNQQNCSTTSRTADNDFMKTWNIFTCFNAHFIVHQINQFFQELNVAHWLQDLQHKVDALFRFFQISTEG